MQWWRWCGVWNTALVAIAIGLMGYISSLRLPCIASHLNFFIIRCFPSTLCVFFRHVHSSNERDRARLRRKRYNRTEKKKNRWSKKKTTHRVVSCLVCSVRHSKRTRTRARTLNQTIARTTQSFFNIYVGFNFTMIAFAVWPATLTLLFSWSCRQIGLISSPPESPAGEGGGKLFRKII